jgi:hypothetical protein
MNTITFFQQNLPKNMKTIAVPLDNNESSAFWDIIENTSLITVPNPELISNYKAKKEFSYTPQAITKMIDEKMVRMNKENDSVALEDVMWVKKLHNFFKELEGADVVREEQIFNQNKLLVMDLFKHKKSLTKYQIEIVERVVRDYTADIYDLIPKILTLEEKIDLIKKNHPKDLDDKILANRANKANA